MDKEGIIGKIGVQVGGKLLKEIEDGSKSATFIALLIAGFLDFSDVLIIGQIPILGTMLKIIGAVIITYILWDVGGFIKWKVRLLLWIGTPLIEIWPLLAFFPTYTLSIWWAHHKIKERAGQAKIELDEALAHAA